MAAVHIICGPSDADRTGRLFERYHTVNRSAIGAALWITPAQRDVETLRSRLLVSSVLAPNLLTFPQFVEEIIRINDREARPLSDVQRRLLVDEVLTELHEKKELSHFERVIDTRGFGDGIFALLAELKRNEIWPTAFARAAFRRGYQGGNVKIVAGRTVSRKDYQCASFYATYQRRLIRHHLYDMEGRFWYARDLLTRGRRRPFEHIRALFVDGFTSFTRTQYEMLAAFAPQVEELWITLPDDPVDERDELFRTPRGTAKKLEATLATVTPRFHHEIMPGRRDLYYPPAGIAQLTTQLFRPLRSVVPSPDAAGIRLIEAPGPVGEARLVARAIKTLLLDGVAASDILVSLRAVPPSADLLREVFAEYGIPIDVEGAEPLLRNPAVATLLRALRLPDDDWPFAGVTALLRSGYFCPDWPETRADASLPQRAEVLLRLLGEPRGRDAYLAAVERWARFPPSGLEDEEAEEPRRRRTHELAVQCHAFLHRFFRAWDEAPLTGTLTEHVAWLRRFAADLGIQRTADQTEADRAAVQRFWAELEQWCRLDATLTGARPRERAPVGRMLMALATQAVLPRSPRGPGRVRVLSAELARNLDVPYLFLMGLGERSFPDLSAPEPVFDEGERQSFRDAGLDFPALDERLPSEMLLFYQLVTRPRRGLVLSYPAVDNRGQRMLPSSFLAALLACFTDGAVPTIRKRMLIEGCERDAPLAPAEYRVQQATRLAGLQPPLDTGLSAELIANLSDAARMAQQRMEAPDFTPYDGRLRYPAALAELQRRCGPEKVFSPTALEAYVACPFRFFLESVLRLQPLEEPREEIEQTRRGAAFHRALARLHQQLQAVGIAGPTEDVPEHLFGQLDKAVDEYILRAPSEASKALWRIEGERLRRSAARYVTHWQQFVKPWVEQRVHPRPHLFEAAFGLPTTEATPSRPPLVLSADGVEVRVGGRIDRVDVAEVEGGFAFWIIDYKTGRGSHYTPGDLREFRRLQLTLYALAVEEVLLAELGARPLGLAYWLVTESGPKPVVPGSGKQATAWLNDAERWRQMRQQLHAWVATLATNIRLGNFALKPRSEWCTDTCDFGQVCRISQSRREVEAKAWSLPLPVVNSEQEAGERGE
jgi:ATP-dependent helicase/DNAse subunit B